MEILRSANRIPRVCLWKHNSGKNWKSFEERWPTHLEHECSDDAEGLKGDGEAPDPVEMVHGVGDTDAQVKHRQIHHQTLPCKPCMHLSDVFG